MAYMLLWVWHLAHGPVLSTSLPRSLVLILDFGLESFLLYVSHLGSRLKGHQPLGMLLSW